MTAPRNEHPLHNHELDGQDPWTEDTLAAHLVNLHGVDGLPGGETLASLAAIHAALDHGSPAPDQAYLEALRPARRHEKIAMVPCHWHPEDEYPGHRALEFWSSGNNVVLVCLEPPDRAELIRVIYPDPPEHLSEQADELAREMLDRARSSHGAADLADRFGVLVSEAHAAGYRLSLADLQETGEDLDSLIDYLREAVGRLTEDQAAQLAGILDARPFPVAPGAAAQACPWC